MTSAPILALDQGTSSTKACIYEPPGRLLGYGTVPVKRSSPVPGAVEQDPFELIESCKEAARIALREAKLKAEELGGAGLANVGESFIVFDQGGRPLGPVIGWQDTRCGTIIERLRSEGAEGLIEERTGLPLHAEFTAPKLAHFLASNRFSRGVRFGTLDTWIINQLDPSRPFITDRATASRTMLIGLDENDWSEDLLELFRVPRHLLPTIVPCDAPDAAIVIDDVRVPLLTSGYDMGLALLGHACLDLGETKATFGTCLGVMAATGDEPIRADGLLTTIAYSRSDHLAFALDGEIAAAGSLVRWALSLGIASSFEELDDLAASVPDSGGAIIVPAITGLGAPYWHDRVRGEVVGLTEAVGRAEFARAVFDGIAWPLRDVLKALAEAGICIYELRVDGGLARSCTLIQRCADVCQVPLVGTTHSEATSFGAAALAMLAQKTVTPADLRVAARGAARTEPGAPPSAEAEMAWEGAVARALAAAS
jgi:glycerol kinase